MAKKKSSKLTVETLTHPDAGRTNIPTAELQPVVAAEDQKPMAVRYDRGGEALTEEKAARNRDLDPQLVWRGKDEQDWSELVVQAPPIYIQEKVHPKALIDDLVKQTERAKQDEETQAFGQQLDLFADFNGLPSPEAKTEFYRHEGHWSNRMILGDSLQVMASLAEREGLRGKVQCIYFDPPYGIKFNSNFQWSTTSRDVKDGNAGHITREPEQVKAFRDTWRDGIHSYLTYLRDRLTAARDLLTESGSIFVQIGDENVHRVRTVLDEIFGDNNFVSQIILKTTSGAGSPTGGTISLASVHDNVLWYSKDKSHLKYRQIYFDKADMQSASLYRRLLCLDGIDRLATADELCGVAPLPTGGSLFRPGDLTSQSSPESATFELSVKGIKSGPGKGGWKSNRTGLERAAKSNRIYTTRNGSFQYIRKLDDFNVAPINDVWTDVGTGSFTTEKLYVVQTNEKIATRCILMATDPGDLVLDPTCGSGTTAYVAEQWGRRWITIDTSRVALALARARIMGARYPYYLLADSNDGQQKEAQLAGRDWSPKTTHGNIRHGFVYERVPHITLKSIANNAEIDVLYEQHQPAALDALAALNAALKGHKQPFTVTTGGRQGKKVTFDAAAGTTVTLPSGEKAPANALLEWEVPREAPEDWPASTAKPLAAFWEARITRQQAIDASIAAKADSELLYDKPYEDKKKCRVAGPFTVESLSPHRVLGVDEDDELIDPQKVADKADGYGVVQTFDQMILDNLKTAGVQQAHKDDKIHFTSLTGWPGHFLCAEGRYQEGEHERRAGIFIGPEFGTVSRPDLVEAAREAAEAGFDVLIACAFSYEPHTGELDKLGRVRILQARMNADLHMADTLKNTGKGNLFVIFGEPDITIKPVEDGRFEVTVNGVDVFDPSTGEVRSDNASGIACWFIDTDYNGESFFVRHAYFLGQNDPYKSLKTTLKAEIDPDAWATLNSDTSRPFPKPITGRIAVKVINHLGDEVMKVFRV